MYSLPTLNFHIIKRPLDNGAVLRERLVPPTVRSVFFPVNVKSYCCTSVRQSYVISSPNADDGFMNDDLRPSIRGEGGVACVFAGAFGTAGQRKQNGHE